jgi:DNA (cytosine-5)-methyltransferase 1
MSARSRIQLRLVQAKQSHVSHAFPRAPLEVAGLFSGVGGIELGLERAGHRSTLWCEIDPFARAVLEARFHSQIASWSDVCDLPEFPDGAGLVAAGFPCQDLSQAGRTRGIDGSRSGLIDQVFRLLERSPIEWVLIENVPFMLQLARGQALEVIVSEFERLGYKWAYRVVNARAFGLPQRRERVFFLASLTSDPRDVLLVDDAGEPTDSRSFREVACGFYWTEGLRGLGWAIDSVPTLKGGSTIGIPSPPAIIFPDGLIGKPDIRDAERLQGFEADWTLPAESVGKRGHRWKLVGNAVTVNVAEWIGRRLLGPGEYDTAGDVPMTDSRPWPVAAWNVGGGRHVANVSKWPVHRPATPLAEFLQYPVEPLSVKAAAGFLSRARVAKLRFPDGFLTTVERHIERMNGTKTRAII